MAYETFIDKRFHAATTRLIEHANEFCNDMQDQGYRVTLRQVYYYFISHDLFPQSWVDDVYNRKNGLQPGTKNTIKNYKNFGSVVNDARLAGLLDWDAIEDRARDTVTNSHWDSPADILESASRSFRIDAWEGQPNYIECMIEKDALSGILQPVCKNLDISFSANRGYSSSSHLYEVGKRLYAQYDMGKEIHIIYLGDHDPSGIDMSRDVLDRLEMFSGCEVNVHRVALNMDQVLQYSPPENPAKLTDSRAAGYIERFGNSSWELDALSPPTLAGIVTDIIESLRDDDLYEAKVAQQEAWRQELRDIARKFEN